METVIPKTEKQITGNWIEKNTGLKPVEGSISINGNVQLGIGFLSNLCRVSFKTEDGQDKNILVKLLPESAENRALVVDQKFDQIEIKFYSEVKPQLIEVAPELEKNLCKYYGGRFLEGKTGAEYASMLIMEDLKPAGYQIMNPEDDHWETNLERVLTFLATFHAAGCALEAKRNMKISQLFPFCMGVDDSKLNLFLEIAATNGIVLQDILEKADCPDDIKNSYKRIADHSPELMKKVFKKGEEHACLIHGDLWPSNVMLAGTHNPIKIIDWQLLGYRDPTYELTPVILTCLPKKEFKREVIEKFARFYYKEFLKISKSKGLAHVPSRSETEFIEFFNTWGMCYAYIWFIESIEAFPNDPERLLKSFILLEEQYKVVDWLHKLL